MKISVCIPSYKRPKVETLDYIPDARVYVDESEFEDYKKANESIYLKYHNIIPCKKGIQGNLCRIRNHIMRSEFQEGADAVCIILEMFEAGQVEDAQEIVSECLVLFQWADDFSPEANKAILRIVASMKDEVRRILWVNLSIKHKSGLLSDEDFAPFKDDYMLGDKDLEYAENVE